MRTIVYASQPKVGLQLPALFSVEQLVKLLLQELELPLVELLEQLLEKHTPA